MITTSVANGMLPDPLEGKRGATRGSIALVIDRNHTLRFWVILGFIAMTWFMYGVQVMRIASPTELAHDAVEFIARTGYIGLLFAIMLTILRVLWIEYRGFMQLRHIDEERLDMVEIAHPYMPKTYHIIAAIILALTFPLFVWQASAQVAALTFETMPEPQYTAYEEVRAWQIANDADAPAFVAQATCSGAETASIVCNKPSGTLEGHLMLMAISSYIGGAPTPSGWTVLVNNTTNKVVYKIAGASEPSTYTINVGTATDGSLAASITTYSGTSGINVSDSATNTANAPSVTTTVDNTLLVLFGMHTAGGSTTTAPAGTTSVSTVSDTGNNNAHINVATKAAATAGVTGTNAFGASRSRTATVALAPLIDSVVYSISGTAYSDEGTTGIAAGRRVSVSLNGGAAAGSGLTRNGGFFAATLTGRTLTGGTIISVYLDNATEDAVTVTLGSGSSMTGVHLYQNRLIVRSDSGSTALTNNHLRIAKNNADTDITAIYNVDSNNILQVAADKELWVWAGDTFTPGARIKTHDIEVKGQINLGTNGLSVTGSLIAVDGEVTTSTGILLGSISSATESLSVGSGALQNLTIDNGLRAYWQFNEGNGTVAVDRSPNRNAITLTNARWSGSLVAPTKFYNPKAISFSGTSAYGSATNNKSAFDFGTSDMAFTAWVRLTNTNASAKSIFWMYNLAPFYSFEITDNEAVRFRLRDSDSDTLDVQSANSLIGLTWKHIAAVRTGTTGRVYIDGVQVAASTQSLLGAVSPGCANIQVAAQSLSTCATAGSQGYFPGLIDDLRVYGRSLSASEVARLAAGYQDTGSGIYTLGSSLDVNGNLNIVSGGISAGSNTMTIAGNFLNIGGFTKDASSVVFDGSSHQTVSGSTIFNTLSATTSVARTIFFDYGSRQSASGSLALRGIVANLLSLRSTRTGSGARVDLDADASQLSADFAYANVKDINAGSGQTLTCLQTTEGCLNSGNNANWNFGSWSIISGKAYSDEGATALSAGKRVSVSLNGGAAAGSGLTRNGGFFAATLTGRTLTGGTIISIYLDNATEDAVTVTLGSGSSMTGMHLYQNRLIVRSDSGSVALTNAHLNIANNNADSDITAIYNVDSNNILQVVAGKELWVWIGDTFSPGARIRTHDLAVSGSLVLGTNGLTVTGSLITSNGEMSASTGIILASTATSESLVIGSGSLHNLTLNNGLVGYWKFDEGQGAVAKDTSGYGNNGTLTNGPTWSGSTASQFKFNNSNSLSFKGSNARVLTSFAGTLSDFTACAWFKDTALPINYERILDKNVETGFWMGRRSTNTHTWGGGVMDTTGFFGRYVTLTDGSWHHLCSRRSGTTHTIIGNGGAVSVSGTVSASPLDTSTLTIGALPDGQAPMTGLIDDVRIYNRALSASEISRLASGYQDTGSGVYTLGSSLDINGNLAIVSGGISAGSNNINLAGNVANYGTFAKGASTVTLDGYGNQTLSGSTVFNALSATTSTARTIFFDYSGRQSASGSLTLRGLVGNLLSLRSTRSGSGTRVDLDTDATQLAVDFVYADVKDINAGSGQTLTCLTTTEGCVNSANNTNWNFGSWNTVAGTVYSDEGTTGITAGSRVSVSLNGGAAAGSGLTRNGGFYTATLTGVTLTGGTIISVYLDNETEDAVTVTIGSGSSMTGVHLYQNRLIVRSDSGSTAITNNHLRIAKSNGDTDISSIYRVDSSNILQVSPDKVLYIWQGDTYAPGARVKTHDLIISGSLVLGTNGLTVSGSLVATANGEIATSTGILLSGIATSETLAVGSGALANLSINNGLVGYWKFDEGQGTVTKDSSGKGNNGTLLNGTAWSADTPVTQFNDPKSLDFDGVNDAVSLSGVPSPSYPLTIAFWAKPDTSSPVGMFDSAPDAQNVIRNYPAGKVEWWPASPSVNLNVSAGQWVYLAFTFSYDGTRHLTYYKNGIFQETANGVGSVLAWTTLRLGDINNGLDGYYDGKLDDFRIYNRTLSASEIARLAAGYQDTGSGAYTLGSSLDINGNLNIVSGGISAGSNTLNLAGNLANYGTFTKGTSTVAFDGTGNQTISGSTVFNAVSATTSAARTIFFDYSGRQSASGSLTLRGISGNKLSLRSTRSGSGARVDLDADVAQLTTDFAYLDVKDSNAGSGQLLICLINSEGCTDSGNNTNWQFVSIAGTGTVKGLVWNDSNGNGIRDIGENTGVASVAVALTGNTATGGTVNRNTTTAASGLFFFSGSLVSNNAGYTVTVNGNAAPAGYIRTRFNSSGSNVLGTGGTVDVRFGYVLQSSVSGSVFIDINKDGMKNVGESNGVNGVSVSLSGTSATGGIVTGTSTTSGFGTFSFLGLPPSSLYTASIASGIPAGYVPTRGTSTGIAITVGGTSVQNAHLGYYWYGTMSGVVFTDTDTDGTLDTGENGRVAGATVTVTGTTSTGASISQSRITSSTGAFFFSQMPISTGTYAVTLTVPAYKSATTAVSFNRSITAGSNAPSTSFGLIPVAATGTVKGFVWNDENGDGIRDSGENTGLASILVALTGTTATGGTIDWSTTTASSGLFFFSGALVSNDDGYTVTVNGNAAPAGYIRTRFNASGSNVLGTGGVIDVRFGYVLPSTISGSVFIDADENGEIDAGETTYFSGATLSLTGVTGTGGSVDMTTVTSASGTYSFSGLPTAPAGYLLVIDPPNGYTTTTTNSRTVIVGTGGQLKPRNFGYVLTPVSSSSSSATSSSSTASSDASSADVIATTGGGSRNLGPITIRPQVVPSGEPDAGGAASSEDSGNAVTSDSEGVVEQVREIIRNVQQRRDERAESTVVTQEERIQRTKERVTTWLIGGEETVLLQVSPIVQNIVNAPEIVRGIVSGTMGTLVIARDALATRSLYIAREIGDAVGLTVGAIAAGVQSAGDMTVALTSRVLGVMGENGQVLADRIASAWSSTSETAGTVGASVADNARQTASAVIDASLDAVLSVTDGVVALGTALDDTADFIAIRFSDATDSLTVALGGATETMTSVADGISTGIVRSVVQGTDIAREIALRARENITVAFERVRRGVSRTEIAQLPPARQYETDIRKEGGQILIAQLHLSVLDSLGFPVSNTPVVLFSTPKIATTNDEGVATFHDVEAGEHRLEVHVQGEKVESRAIIIEPPSDVSLEDLERVEALLPVIQVVIDQSALHAAAPSSLVTWLSVTIAILAMLNIAWVSVWIWKRYHRHPSLDRS